MKVTVKDIPVRYNDKDYEPGDTLTIKEEHFIEQLFDEEKPAGKKPISK